METGGVGSTVSLYPAFLNFLRGMETLSTIFACLCAVTFLNFLRGMETLP